MKSYSPKISNNHLAWKAILETYGKALGKTGTDYCSSVTEENQTVPRFLFSSVSKLAKGHSDLDTHVPSTPNSENFVSLIADKCIKNVISWRPGS